MRLRLLMPGLALVASGLVPSPAQAKDGDTWTVPTAATITVTGHGWGHGHGMSQYGARGAARQGLSWRQIVGFYYPGTQVARAGGRMRVLITADTTRDVVVDAQRALRLHRIEPGRGPRSVLLAEVRPRASRWRIVPLGDGARSRVDYRLRGTHVWRRWTVASGGVEFAAGREAIRLRLPEHAAAAYHGTLRSVDRQTVNVVPMEDYVRGVVPSEMPSTWEPQAVRAQAVAARTYATYERAAAVGGYDICDTSACQVYGGTADEEAGSDRAVRRTAHTVLTYGGAPAFSQFSSSDGGWSSTGSEPYLVAQPDPYEAASENPYATWSVDLGDTDIERAYPRIGDLTSISLTGRDGHGDWGGRIGDVVLTGSTGSTVVPGDDFRATLELRSTWFTITTATRSAGSAGPPRR